MLYTPSGAGALTLVNVPVSVNSTTQHVWNRAGWLTGWGFATFTGDPNGFCDFYNGSDAGGQHLFQLILATAVNSLQRPGLPGWPLDTGLFLSASDLVLVGSVTIAY